MVYFSGENLPELKFAKVFCTHFCHIVLTCRITAATQGFTQLQESIDRLVAWLDDAEVRATGGGDLENSERLELLQVCWISKLVFRIVRLCSYFYLGYDHHHSLFFIKKKCAIVCPFI